MTAETRTIFVALLDECVDVWRPVQAERVGATTCRILEQPYDRTIERWRFEPGDVVECEPVESAQGRILVAVRRAPEHTAGITNGPPTAGHP